ncbi:MAG: CofH family radical SAM protein [Alistipes sp.]|nr:CofH family radical SAM protein [Alistipes sp.]
MLQVEEKYAALADKVDQGGRLSRAEALALAEAPLSLLGLLATHAKERKSGKRVYYNRNFHVEPTNVCVFNCRFCSYRRPADSPEAWDYTPQEILAQVEARRDSGATEVHIVGGVHPRHDLYFYVELIRQIKQRMPQVAVKAFTAIELAYMIDKAGLTPAEGLQLLKDAGMAAIPGGGAEIFDETIRAKICPEKGSSRVWLKMHREAHRLGIPTNATILYGHIEGWRERIDHLDRLRTLQDETGGFNAFIPLKYRSLHNSMADLGEVSIVEDMRMAAMSRLYLDNFPHIKAYWPMFGRTTAQIALTYGADDMDGTIDDTTRIYSMAGAEDQKPSMSSTEMQQLIRDAGFDPVERDTFYQPVAQRA